MPIFLADVQTAGELPVAFQHALLRMTKDVAEDPVTPARALQLLNSRVAPLLGSDHQSLLEIDGQPSWQRLRMLVPKLAAASRGGKDEMLLAAATLVQIVVRYSSRPHREDPEPEFVEVSSFRRVCRYLLIPDGTHQRRLMETGWGLYSFCKYCWLPAFARGTCQFHTVSAATGAPSASLPLCAAVRYKTVQRLRGAFVQNVLALASSEEMAFHQSGFDLPLLFPPSGLRAWLAERRPRLAAVVRPSGTEVEDSVLPDLMRVLYGDQADEIKESIGAAVHVLTPITLRAEAWLAAWLERPTWGGARRKRARVDGLPIAPAED